MKGDFTHASESFKKRNPHLYGRPVGSMETSKPESPALSALDIRKKTQPSGETSMANGVEYRVVLVCHVRRVLDDDNLQGACKSLRDSIAETLGIDDGDKRISWTYHQIIDRYEGVAVKITAVQPINQA